MQMHKLALVIAICVAVQVAIADREKPGQCNNRVKREQCQCAPHGDDDCGDQCSEDYDCTGQRKCCTVVCKRVCTLAPYRPDFRCPPDQTPDPCPPSTDPTCPGPLPPRPQPPPPPPPAANITPCVPRCVCRPGYVKAEDGRCIQKIKCPPAPPPSIPICSGFHEIYYPCYEGCQGSCANPNGNGCVVRSCVRGCFCAPGLVRNGHSRCIRPQACPPQIGILTKPPPRPSPPLCPQNQEFSACKRECEGTCINKQPRGCFRRCQAGCFCQSPYVRDHYGNCVHPEQCVVPSTVAPRCGDREEYRFCSTKCQSTCENPRAENCYARCQTGCFCIDGYVRADSGMCIPAYECRPIDPIEVPPPTPGRPICENDLEEYIECHRGCQRTCDNPSGQGCSTEECHSGCYCQPGLVRNHLGHCVAQHACESIGCGYHEHFEECGPSCPPTCPNGTRPGAGGGCEADDQCHSGCYCDDGYIRKEGNCVPTNHCRSRHQCASNEDSVPCGQVCDQNCRNGWGTQSCPSSCRRRCCRRIRV